MLLLYLNYVMDTIQRTNVQKINKVIFKLKIEKDE